MNAITENNDQQFDALNQEKQAKSRSVLSRYMSSRQDKYSIDFDDFQPHKANGINGNVPGLHSKTKSKNNDFFEYSDIASIKNTQTNNNFPISRISSYESDEVNHDPYEEAKESGTKNVKAYNGKKIKSRQADIKQDSTKFQTAQFGQTTLSPKTQVGPPTLTQEETKSMRQKGKPKAKGKGDGIRTSGRVSEDWRLEKGSQGIAIGGYEIEFDESEEEAQESKSRSKAAQLN